MLKEHKTTLASIFHLADILIILTASYVAYSLTFGWKLDLSALEIQYAALFCAYMLLWLYLSNRFHLYASKRIHPFRSEAFDVVKVSSICLAISTIPALFIGENMPRKFFLFNFWYLQATLSIAFRFFLREYLKYIRRRGYNYREILIVGRNTRASRIANKIQETPEYGLRLLGFIDANGNANGACCDEFKLLGDLSDLESILRNKVVDEVFVTLPFKSHYSKIERIINICENVGVEVVIPMDLFNLNLSKSGISKYDEVYLITYFTSPRMSWQLIVKRCIDLTVSSFLLAFFSPLLLVLAALIKFTSEGPALFKQQRVGYNGRLFNCLKFRTMVNNAEALKKSLLSLNEMDGPVFKIKNDPRITKVGRFLRKTSIDELPQLINVLKGDMSLVGPRPPLPDEVTEYDLINRRRLSMKPGITCIWQVNGRNNIPFDKWMDQDREYIDKWSLWLDIKILVKTIPAVLRGSGA